MKNIYPSPIICLRIDFTCDLFSKRWTGFAFAMALCCFCIFRYPSLEAFWELSVTSDSISISSLVLWLLFYSISRVWPVFLGVVLPRRNGNTDGGLLFHGLGNLVIRWAHLMCPFCPLYFLSFDHLADHALWPFYHQAAHSKGSPPFPCWGIPLGFPWHGDRIRYDFEVFSLFVHIDNN